MLASLKQASKQLIDAISSIEYEFRFVSAFNLLRRCHWYRQRQLNLLTTLDSLQCNHILFIHSVSSCLVIFRETRKRDGNSMHMVMQHSFRANKLASNKINLHQEPTPVLSYESHSTLVMIWNIIRYSYYNVISSFCFFGYQREVLFLCSCAILIFRKYLQFKWKKVEWLKWIRYFVNKYTVNYSTNSSQNAMSKRNHKIMLKTETKDALDMR